MGCGSDEETDEHDEHDHAEAFDATTMLSDFANGLVLTTYTDLDNKAGELLAAVKALEGDTSQGESRKSTASVDSHTNTLGTERSVPVRSLLTRKASTQH